MAAKGAKTSQADKPTAKRRARGSSATSSKSRARRAEGPNKPARSTPSDITQAQEAFQREQGEHG